MINWYEALPGFLLPTSCAYDPARWPDFTRPEITDALEDLPDPSAILRFNGVIGLDRKQWGAWLSALQNDRAIVTCSEFYLQVADRMYETARYKFLVPAWRRAITDIIGEIDDIEDQLSTILWVLEWITRKVVPLPKSVMNGAQKVQRTLDCAENMLAGVTIFRSGKSEYADCLRKQQRARDAARNQRAGLLAWFKENWGRLLEAAQATNTWFDVGIVLGPIMGWIEEGMWGLAQSTTDNYLVAVDAVLPGYSEDFYRNAEELSDSVSQAWDDTWEGLSSWDTETIEEEFPGLWAP
jgi:hypothetical protein